MSKIPRDTRLKRAFRVALDAVADINPDLAGDIDDWYTIVLQRTFRLTERAQRAEGTWRDDAPEAAAARRARRFDQQLEMLLLAVPELDRETATNIVGMFCPELLDPEPVVAS